MGRSRSKPRGVCNRCGHDRTLVSLSRGHCKPCGYEKGNCSRCKTYRKLYVLGRCYLCYQDDLLRPRLDRIQTEFATPASKYNLYLFELYLTYLRRHRMSYDHLKPTTGLVKVLGQTPIQPILSWNDIYRLSRRQAYSSRIPWIRSELHWHSGTFQKVKIPARFQRYFQRGPRPVHVRAAFRRTVESHSND